LDFVTYLTYLRDAFIFNCNQTEKGREYLENAWYLSQDSMDKNTLREMFGR